MASERYRHLSLRGKKSRQGKPGHGSCKKLREKVSFSRTRLLSRTSLFYCTFEKVSARETGMSFWVLAQPYGQGGALTESKKAREKASVATALKPSAGRAIQLSPKNSLLSKDTATFL